MGLSARHTRRLLAAYRESGAAAIAHGNRGRRPSNTTSDTVIAEVVHLARTRYQGAALDTSLYGEDSSPRRLLDRTASALRR